MPKLSDLPVSKVQMANAFGAKPLPFSPEKPQHELLIQTGLKSPDGAASPEYLESKVVDVLPIFLLAKMIEQLHRAVPHQPIC